MLAEIVSLTRWIIAQELMHARNHVKSDSGIVNKSRPIFRKMSEEDSILGMNEIEKSGVAGCLPSLDGFTGNEVSLLCERHLAL